MITPVSKINTVGLFGTKYLEHQVIPAILPGFDLWRSSDQIAEYSSTRRIGSKSHVAQSDVILLSATLNEGLLRQLDEMAKPDTVFVTVVGSAKEKTLQFLRKECKHPWFAIEYRKPTVLQSHDRREKRRTFKQLLHIKPKDLRHILPDWLPLFGAKIIERSQALEEKAA